jgi:demethylmenaquinone methyltransferase/2-methoxy-6-polyprenyl-1,4-benzoquinol methylase
VRDAELLAEQQRYYRARAPEYDAWWERRGRYDRGADANARWFAETRRLERELEQFAPRGRVLELACGTGLWTRQLVRHAQAVTALDGAQEMLALNRQRLRREPNAAAVEYLRADLFNWRPPQAAYDVCFFAFWLSHVPASRFRSFWELVASSLRPGGRVFFIDSARNEASTASDHLLPAPDDEIMQRRLDDGREFHIVKRFYDPPELERRLCDLGFEVDVRRTGEFFIYGMGVAQTCLAKRP